MISYTSVYQSSIFQQRVIGAFFGLASDQIHEGSGFITITLCNSPAIDSCLSCWLLSRKRGKSVLTRESWLQAAINKTMLLMQLLVLALCNAQNLRPRTPPLRVFVEHNATGNSPSTMQRDVQRMILAWGDPLQVQQGTGCYSKESQPRSQGVCQ
jgi:hypothetical protein